MRRATLCVFMVMFAVFIDFLFRFPTTLISFLFLASCRSTPLLDIPGIVPDLNPVSHPHTPSSSFCHYADLHCLISTHPLSQPLHHRPLLSSCSCICLCHAPTSSRVFPSTASLFATLLYTFILVIDLSQRTVRLLFWFTCLHYLPFFLFPSFKRVIVNIQVQSARLIPLVLLPTFTVAIRTR